MPVLEISGIPSGTPNLPDLILALRTVTARVLKIPQDGVSVFIRCDLVQEGLGEEIVIAIDEFFQFPHRGPEVKQRLAEQLAQVLEYFVLQDASLSQICTRVVAYGRPYNQHTDGHAVYEPLSDHRSNKARRFGRLIAEARRRMARLKQEMGGGQ